VEDFFRVRLLLDPDYAWLATGPTIQRKKENLSNGRSIVKEYPTESACSGFRFLTSSYHFLFSLASLLSFVRILPGLSSSRSGVRSQASVVSKRHHLSDS
jgi:hypothetical protein